MSNIKLTISYDGTLFYGFQIQPNKRTIEQELLNALNKLTNDVNKLIGSGRTDRGVHARKQIINFHTASRIPINKWPIALNSILPADIQVLDAQVVADDFHARYNVLKKTYRYYLTTSPFPDIFQRNYTYAHPIELNWDRMQAGCQYLIGTHDFSSFSASNTEVKNKVRTIYQCQIEPENGRYYFEITGNGFLYNMVRIIIGTLILLGEEKINEKELAQIIEARDRTKAGKTVPAHGLFLWDVVYDQNNLDY